MTDDQREAAADAARLAMTALSAVLADQEPDVTKTTQIRVSVERIAKMVTDDPRSLVMAFLGTPGGGGEVVASLATDEFVAGLASTTGAPVEDLRLARGLVSITGDGQVIEQPVDDQPDIDDGVPPPDAKRRSLGLIRSIRAPRP